ncbi:response regulator [Stigmatella erecta]|uniref:Response regulator receiver domain-containing protein n=1 Tax=Stigmatella erecta TaxID=83460 RepID=A0A1I0LF79_9BACT|nr:response regulator [Stigmatella erecta]SEU38735.1 Response regulator receiver domain-containing protein [Stigmatella erecta]
MAKILIVDDEVQVASALRRLFRREGFAVEVALNGEEALEKLTTFQADLVISDFRMKGMNGAELLERVLRVCPQAVRILLSGHADLWSSTPSSAAQAVSHFISKPWDDDHLVARVRTLLGGQQSPSTSSA